MHVGHIGIHLIRWVSTGRRSVVVSVPLSEKGAEARVAGEFRMSSHMLFDVRN